MNRYPWLEEYLLKKPGAVTDYKLEWDRSTPSTPDGPWLF